MIYGANYAFIVLHCFCGQLFGDKLRRGSLSHSHLVDTTWGQNNNRDNDHWKPRWEPHPPPRLPRPFSTFQTTKVSSQTSTIDQCPCVRASGSNDCVTYDPRYQAATWSEAIVNFPDLTNQSKSADASDPSVILGRGERFKCRANDQHCQRCAQLIINHLYFIDAIDDNERGELIQQLDVPDVKFETMQQFKQSGIGLDCDRYRFTKQPRQPRPHAKEPHNLDGPLRELQKAGRDNWSKRQPQPRIDRRGGGGWGGQWRGKRQTDLDELLGEATRLQCSDRGSEDVDTGTLNMCGICWVWRKLPSNYFPSYINEIECQATEGAEGSCLSGFGNCRRKTRNLSVLKNVGTEDSPNWQPESIAAGACCDCQVPSGSGIHSLITDSPN